MPQTSTWLPQVGLIGLGELGEQIGLKLADSKFVLSVYDTNAKRLEPFSNGRVQVPNSIAELALKSDVILLSLPDSAAVINLIEQQLLPVLQAGKIVVDLGMTDVNETRRLAVRLEAKSIGFLDAPISGTASDVKRGTLAIFAGGRRESFDRCAGVFTAIAGLGNFSFCGPAGTGQIVKAVDELILGLCSAGYLEAIAFGARNGIEPMDLAESLKGSASMRLTLENVTKRLVQRGGEAVEVKYGHLPQVLKAAEVIRQDMPLTRAITEYLRKVPPTVIEHGQHVPSFWLELRRNK